MKKLLWLWKNFWGRKYKIIYVEKGLQKNENYSYSDKYAIVGKSYANTEIVYNKFTTPSDLIGYGYLVARVNGYKKMTFKDIVVIEGNYDESNFLNI